MSDSHNLLKQTIPELGWKKLTPAALEDPLNKLDEFTC